MIATTDPQPDQGKPPPRKRRRPLKRLVLLVIMLLIAAPLAVGWWFTRPAQLIPIIEQALYESTGCHAHIDHASVNFRGEIVLTGVTLTVPGTVDDFATFLTAKRIDMAGDPMSLIDGSYRPELIDIIEPTLHLTEQRDTGLFNYEMIAAPEGGDTDQPIPRITIQQGLIRFDQISADGLERLGQMGVAGELRPDPDSPKGYLFSISETDAPQGKQNIQFTGGFDLIAPSLDLRADHFRFSDEQRYFVPADFRAWWQRLSPSGSVPTLSLSLRPNERGLLDLDEVRLELVDIGLNLDVLDLSDPEQRDVALLLRAIRSRLTKLNGELRIEQNRFELTAAGRVEQQGLGLSSIAYDIQASGGLTQGEPYRAKIQTKPFSLSERYQFGLALSPMTGEAYRRFRPSGRFAMTASIRSDGSEKPPDWAIDLDVIKGKMTHAMFPIPLQNIAGPIRIRPDRVAIGPLAAKSISGAALELDGYAQPASDIAEVKLGIHITDLPIDQYLIEALDPGARKNIARFFDQTAYNRLVDTGVIAPAPSTLTGEPTQDKTASSALPFALGGRCSVFVPIYRPYGEDGDYSVIPVVQARGLSILMRDFSYPVTGQAGTIELGKDFVNIDGLIVESPSGGAIKLNGSAKKGPDGEYRPEVAITDARLPIDPLLMGALEPEARELLTDLNLDGRISLAGKVFQPIEALEPDLLLDVEVMGASVRPYGGAVKVDDVNGSFKLRAKGIDALSVAGKRGDATIGIAGSVDWTDVENTTAELRFTPKNMAWSADLVEVLPPDSEVRAELTSVFDEFMPAGVFDATIDWSPRPEGVDDGFSATVLPRDLAINLLGGRLAFREMSGKAIIFDQLMQLDQLAGSFFDPAQPESKGRLQASGDISFDKNPRIGLTFSGTAHTASPTTRLLLPNGANRVIDDIGFAGLLSVDQAQLIMANTGSDEQATDFEANFALSDAAFAVGGLRVTEFQGELGVEVRESAEQQASLMVYNLKADTMRASERLVTGFRIAADNRADRGVLRAGRGTGSIYGGTVVLEASIDLETKQDNPPAENAEPTGGVRLNASIHDVELRPLLKPEAPWQPRALDGVIQRDLDSGLISGSLLLETSYDPDGPRYGRGNVSLRDAGLLSETPLGLLMLQTINLSFPDQRGFDRGGAQFDINGDTVTFRTLWMENRGSSFTLAGQKIFKQGLRIAGDGTLTYPEMALDLKLKTTTTGTAESLPFQGLFSSLMNELAGIQVKGTLEEPKVSYVPLRGTRDALGELVGDEKD